MRGTTQRICLLLLGIGLASSGVWLAITTRASSPSVASPAALIRSVTELYRDSTVGFAVLPLVGAILIALGIVMTIRQLRPLEPQIRTATLAASTRGVTTADARAVTRAVARDASTIAGVTTANVRLTELEPAKALLRVGVVMDADIPPIVDSLRVVLTRLESTLGTSDARATASIAFTDTRSPRVE